MPHPLLIDPPLSAILRVLPCLLLLSVAPYFLARRGLKLTRCEAALVGPLLGLAIWVVVQRVLDALHAPLFPWVPIVVLGVTSIAALGLRLAKAERGEAGDRDERPLVVIALASLALLLVPMAWQLLPPGWDPSFHSLLAERVTALGALPTTWEPFEHIPLTMPVGLHGFLAGVHLITRVAVPRVLQVVLAALVASSAGLVGLIAGRDSPRAGICAGVIYAFGASFCALDYIRWGGITNAAGMALLLAGLFLLAPCAADVTRRREIIAGLLLGLVGWVHHHAMLATALVVGATAVYEVATRRDDLLRRWARVSGAAVLAGLPLVAHYLSRLATLQETRVFSFTDELGLLRSPAALLEALGVPLALALVATALGLSVTWKADALRLAVVRALALLLAFALGRYAYGWWALRTTGHAADAFSALRFFSDSVYFLAIAAGIGIARLQAAARPPLRRAVAVALAIACAVHVGSFLRGERGVATPDSMIRALAWLKAHAEPDALVVSDAYWLPALTGLESSYTPVPISEAVSDASLKFKREVLRRDPAALAAWSRQQQRPVYIFAERLPDTPSLESCFDDGPFPVYRFRVNPEDHCPGESAPAPL
jgi:hypothetical protein